MAKFFRFNYTIALALVLMLAASGAFAQRGTKQRRINRPPLGDPQFGRRADRQPAVEPQRIKKQRLQQQLMRAIGLTDNQRVRMSDIRRSYDDELAAAGRRLRQARQALDRAIMDERFNEAMINQRTEDLAAAQAEMIRLQSRVRAQVRSVLTTEQVIRFHELERQLRRQMREQRRTQEEKMQEQSQSNPPEEEIDLLSLLPPPPNDPR